MARILIVEDETRISDFLDRGLRAAGYTTSVASDGESGLHLALAGDVDLVVLDLVWGFDFAPGSNVVDVYIAQLRTKVGRDRIETVRGAGYRFRR